MENAERFFMVEKWYDERYDGEPDLTLTIKEYPDLYLHIWDGYFDNIFHKNFRTNGIYWAGFTRDNQEFIRTFSDEVVEIENLDEYITDLLLYKDLDFEKNCYSETKEVYNDILDFLTFAKQNGLTVIAQYD